MFDERIKAGEVTRENAIIVVSIGDRPWVGHVLFLARLYAKKCNADLILENVAPDLDQFPLAELPDTPGRANKRIYACKAYFAWKHLAASGYKRVLLIDDSCCISARAPDLFKISTSGSVLYTTTGSSDAQRSFADISKFISTNALMEITYDADLYMNSGVMLYDHEMCAALSPDKICGAAELLFSRFPHQSLTYYLLQSAGVKMQKVDRRFNHVPGVNLDKEIRRSLEDILPHLRDNVYIHHVTGMYRNRDTLIRQICGKLATGWKET